MRSARVGLAVTLGLLGAVMGGCSGRSASIELVSYKDPYFPEKYSAEFPECVFRVDRLGNHQILARSSRFVSGGGSAIAQIIHINLFWKPVPGKTPSDRSGVDATIRYGVFSKDGLASYSGAGFAYVRRPWPARDGAPRPGDKLIVQLERAELRLDTTTGDPPELFGETRLTGELVATFDPNRAIALVRELDLGQGGHLTAARE